jgi:galactose mutarotase-like enzyme
MERKLELTLLRVSCEGGRGRFSGGLKHMADFMDFPTEREKVLTNVNTSVGVIPELCLVSHFQVGAWEVLYRPTQTGNVKRWGIPLMIPNFGKLQDGIFKEKGTSLPMHGFGRNLPWTVVKQDQQSISLQLQSSDVTRKDYPYEFTFTSTVEADEGTLTYTLAIENRSDEEMPIAPGFHPYFSVSQNDKIKIVTDGPDGFSIGDFKWDTNPPDNAYPFPHQVTVEIPRKGTLIISEVPWNGQYSLKTMQVWSEPASAPDHAFVCFEPVVASADGLNRPEDRLNIAPHSTHQIILQLSANPL